MEINNNSIEAKILAFYLPQFFPNPFNNKHYGVGFTEWTNVGKAKPLYKGHNQPRVPADLGYYDLRVPEVAEQQADLAREANVFGFAYWHYWWSGKRLLNEPSERMLKSLRPDFPFMFAWANENWYKKLWTADKKDDILLMEQTYPGEEDNKAHFEYCLPFFMDKRYITYDGRPVFLIYRPTHFPEVASFIKQWNDLIKVAGVADSFYFVGMAYRNDEVEKLKSFGFDCASPQHNLRMPIAWFNTKEHIKAVIREFFEKKLRLLRTVDYTKYPETVWREEIDSREDIAPQIIPNWDNTPRAGKRGLLYKHATPEIFEMAASKVMDGVRKKRNKMVFLKSWNEWAEGNYMEPDLQYGHGFIQALHNAVENSKNSAIL